MYKISLVRSFPLLPNSLSFFLDRFIFVNEVLRGQVIAYTRNQDHTLQQVQVSLRKTHDSDKNVHNLLNIPPLSDDIIDTYWLQKWPSHF